MTMNDSRPPKPKRCWYQFSLRMLLVFVLLLSVPLGWLAMKMQRARKQKEAMEMIVGMRGELWYEHEYRAMVFFSGKGVKWTPKPKRHKWLRTLLTDDGLSKVVYADCGWRGFRDVDIPKFNGLGGLQRLKLSGSDITDTGVTHLRGMTTLLMLELDFTQVTDAGLVHLEGLTNLEILSLRHTHVTDDGAKKLQQALPNCRISHYSPYSE